MNWTNVRLILAREIRDQLRDRRTLFMIFVLPLLLYPLMGLSFAQIGQFVRERATRVRLIGQTQFEGLPPLVVDGSFAPELFVPPNQARLLELEFGSPAGLGLAPSHEAAAGAAPEEAVAAMARTQLREGQIDAVVYFPPDFAERLEKFRDNLRSSSAPQAADVPSPVIYYNTVQEKSQLTFLRVSDVLSRWREAVGRQNLEDSRLPVAAARPFDVAATDLADSDRRRAALWAKILPFVLLLWALTGAFYPAIDLCAGEKERGTLETLLCSPAQRGEIVLGKLVTIMLFSMTTSLLNLICMGLTGVLALKQIERLGPPPLADLPWLMVALVPISALFSALCLALAAFARSSKEGQYYLMPLVLVTMPLTMLPMAPGVELNLGSSLIPVTGMVLLLRTILEGSYLAALTYAPAVLGVTLVCCLLAIRWAADQFNKESVLFRESERLDVGLWLRHLVRDREATPAVGQAVFCGTLILAIKFFLSAAAPPNIDLVTAALTAQLAAFLTPTLLMTVFLTRSPRATLLLRWPRPAALLAALLLALALNPVVAGIGMAVNRIYPLNDAIKDQLQALFHSAPSLGIQLLIIAALPAICEELAFRGFILSGLRHLGRKWRAIIISSLFFGVAHGVLQQSIVATAIGLVLGYVAVQTGSLLPGMLVHLTHNGLLVWQQHAEKQIAAGSLGWLFREVDGGYEYRWPVIAAATILSAAILVWFRQLPYAPSAEESLQQEIERHAAEAA